MKDTLFKNITYIFTQYIKFRLKVVTELEFISYLRSKAKVPPVIYVPNACDTLQTLCFGNLDF